MKRGHLLGAALAVTLTLAAVVAAQDGPETEPVVAALERPQRLVTAAPAPAPTEARARMPWAEPSAQALQAWSAPPAPPPPPVPAATAPRPAEPAGPPPPPAFPYQWFGSLQDPRGTTAMLGNEQRSLVARAGDTIDANWRVERVSERRLELIWLPSGQPVPVLPR